LHRGGRRTSNYTLFYFFFFFGHPPGRERWHAPSSRHLRALLIVCGRCSVGGLGCCSCRVRVCVGVGGVVLCRCVCVRDLLIFLHLFISCLLSRRTRRCAGADERVYLLRDCPLEYRPAETTLAQRGKARIDVDICLRFFFFFRRARRCAGTDERV